MIPNTELFVDNIKFKKVILQTNTWKIQCLSFQSYELSTFSAWNKIDFKIIIEVKTDRVLAFPL